MGCAWSSCAVSASRHHDITTALSPRQAIRGTSKPHTHDQAHRHWFGVARRAHLKNRRVLGALQRSPTSPHPTSANTTSKTHSLAVRDRDNTNTNNSKILLGCTFCLNKMNNLNDNKERRDACLYASRVSLKRRQGTRIYIYEARTTLSKSVRACARHDPDTNAPSRGHTLTLLCS